MQWAHLPWILILQMIENYEAKSLFLSSKIHRSVFLSGQAIENTKNVDILEKPCIKNH